MSIDDDFKAFQRKLVLEAALDAEKVVDDADSLERESLSVQTIVDDVLAHQWSQRDISPADWGTISLFYRENVQAQRLLDSIDRDAAFARVAQADHILVMAQAVRVELAVWAALGDEADRAKARDEGRA